MVDLTQYPHYLYAEKQTEATRDTNGTYKPGTSEWQFIGVCRCERNGQAAEIITQDGKHYVYSAVVYLPRQEMQPIGIGTRLIVSRTKSEPVNIAERIKSGVILIDKPNATMEIGRLHNRIWV